MFRFLVLTILLACFADAHAGSCSTEQLQNGCETRARQHCYPMIGCDGPYKISCYCPTRQPNATPAPVDPNSGLPDAFQNQQAY
jgi:hypothetical protein